MIAASRRAALREFLRLRGARSALPEFFALERDDGQLESPRRCSGFPGRCARAGAGSTDALAPGRSRATPPSPPRSRAGDYFGGVEVAVAHPPPHRAARLARFDHFFTVSRLDAPKRVALIVEPCAASNRVPLTWPAGPEEACARSRQATSASASRVRWRRAGRRAVSRRARRAVRSIQRDYGFIAAKRCARQAGRHGDDSGGPRAR